MPRRTGRPERRLADQAVQRVACGAGEFFQGRAHGLRDQFEAGQVADGGQDVGGVGALGGALADQAGLFQPGQGEVEEAVRPAVPQQAVAEGETVTHPHRRRATRVAGPRRPRR
ncbi:hypothetical protein [Kitasatospora sp. NPDC088134]|uniref:hypothetical protein n=1 Tax=Kitasatospora sp. NPDC088134 TaxID=3364071 RepID=UPI003813F98B